MISGVFETERFRVHITGKSVWVESKDGLNWVFCNQHALPVSAECGDSEALRAAVEHYEETRGGDDSLRSALTGIRKEPVRVLAKAPVKTTPKPAMLAAKPHQKRIWGPGVRGAVASRGKKFSGYFGFRTPLRPPLMTTPNA